MSNSSLSIDTLINRCLIIAGKRNSGKTHLAKHLVKYFLNEFDKVFCISPSAAINKEWHKIIPNPDKTVLDEYNEKWVLDLIGQMSAANKGKNAHSKDQKHVLLILDDIVSSSFVGQHSNALKTLASRGRHVGITILVITQNICSTSPLLRNCADWYLLGRVNRGSMEIMREQFDIFGMKPNEWFAFINKNTTDYKFLVLSQLATKSDSPDEVFGTILVPTNSNGELVEGPKPVCEEK